MQFAISHVQTASNADTDWRWDRLASTIHYHLTTLWLFTCNDLKDMVWPTGAFALCHGLAFVKTGSPLAGDNSAQSILLRIPMTLLWAYMNLIPFVVSNQRQPLALVEDGINKPWRPMPSRRITAIAARHLTLASSAAAILTSLAIGRGTLQSVLLLLLGYAYNDANGSEHWAFRNILNGFGMMSFASGGLEVALQTPTALAFLPWLSIVGGVFASTIHMQDMYDQLGDAAIGRRTIPLVIGDGPARWTIAIPMAIWSFVCPLYWAAPMIAYIAPLSIGWTAACRVVSRRSIKEDRVTWTLWNLWMVTLYTVPIVAAYAGH